MEKRQALVISPFAPYKNVKHAGGKIHYYYLHKLENAVDLTLISAAESTEKDDIAVGGIKARSFIYYTDEKLSRRDKIIHKIAEKNPFDKCSGFIRHDILSFLYAAAKDLKRGGYSPDYILLDWTQAIFLAKKIKRLFPNAKLLCIEQDVTYLKYDRIYKQSKTFKTKIKNKMKYFSLKRAELKSLSYASEIVTLNCKDTELLRRENPALNIRVIAPYFEKYNHAVYKNTSADIVFYGAMSRPENYNAAVWFIENVFSHLPPQFRFIIAGANPDKVLAAYKSDRILITGYVENPVSIFERSLCLVVPLLLGAGIKIKILEGMSSGIPVITNSIGIEGIPAKADVDYIHCETAEEYIKAIGKLYVDRTEAAKIGKNGKQFLENTFNYEHDMYIPL